MDKIRKRYNWKSRMIVETEIDNSETKKIKLDLPETELGKYDDSNPLALPSKKRKTKKIVNKSNAKPSPKLLSHRQKKKLQKILELKLKKVNRQKLFEDLAKVQATPEETKQFMSISDMQTKGFKRYSNEQVKLYLASQHADDKQSAIDTVRGSSISQKRVLPSFDDGESSAEDEEMDEENTLEDEQVDEENNITDEQMDADSPITSELKTETDTVSPMMKAECKKPEQPVIETLPTVFKPVFRPPEIQESRTNLPILGEEHVIMEAVHDNLFVIISGETGSGKTTQVPQFLYEAGYTRDGRMIGITEPRRVAAIAMSQRVAEEMSLSSDVVSYQIRYEGNVTEKTEIKFMTDGVLLKEIQNDFLLSKYSVIVIDEAHERSVFTDILVGLLSRIGPLRNKKKMPFRVIIMSATLRVEDFTTNEHLFRTPPPLIQIASRQYPVSVHFNKKTPDDYIMEAFRKVCKIHRQLPSGGILVFVTGQQEVNVLCRTLRKKFPRFANESGNDNDVSTEKDHCTSMDTAATAINAADNDDDDSDDKDSDKPKKSDRKVRQPDVLLTKVNLDEYDIHPRMEEDDAVHEMDAESDIGDLLSEDEDVDDEWVSHEPEQPLFVLPLFSLLAHSQQARVFRPPPDGCRLCVVATNVAETSITIPNIKYVVDTGKVKTRVYDRLTGVSAFHVTWTSKASANQRAGRAGRTTAGHCYRLYSSAIFNDEFATFSTPEICRKPIDDLVLQLKEMNIDRIANFPFPTPVEPSSIQASEQRLLILGALERIRCPPKPGKIIPKGEEFSLKITPLGHAMACFPLAPRYAKMLALSNQHGLLPYTICAVAALSVQEVLQENNLTLCSPEELNDVKIKMSKWMLIRKAWVGQGNSLLLGDVSLLLRSVGAAEFEGCTMRFCEDHGLRFKAMREIRKLRMQLTNEVNLVLPHANLFVDPQMPPLTDLRAKHLRQILLAGLPDCVARKIDESELQGDKEEKLKWKKAYQATDITDPVFIHPNSVLQKELPEFVVYQELFETKKIFMKGVVAIEPEWLTIFCPQLCTFSNPLESPEPRYDPSTGMVKCYMTATFGKMAWALPISERDYPEGMDRVRWFARFFLEGKVCQKLAKFAKHLKVSASMMTKPWVNIQSLTQGILKYFLSEKIDCKAALLKVWETDNKDFLDVYLAWLPEHLHLEVVSIWPPL